MLTRPSRRNYRKPQLFWLRSYPGEISHSNSPNRELSNDLSDVVVWRRKVALHTSSHLTPTEVWRSPDSTTSEGRRILSKVRLVNCTQVWGWAKFEERGTHGWGKILLHTYSDLSRLVRTYAQYTDHVRSSRNVIFCTFERSYSSVLRPILVKLHILTRLIEIFSMVYELMALYWSKIVDPSRSPCLRTVQRKSFERDNFLVLRPVLLKNAYFNSANR